jgi:uncharacterized protein with HEPN domain
LKKLRIYLQHIAEAAEFILSTVFSQEQLEGSKLIRDATIRNFEIMGEATKRLPASFRENHTQIPWRSLAGFCDVLIHNYEKSLWT